ncbi:MBL fold metallo-hydrolase [Actinokineospora soli]|uniref:MBL fold metallo-hydrolase n=1 Tax=Actinokineospora soli TaxID=1048753 RepID=A0ABW2TTV8_9PSEU
MAGAGRGGAAPEIASEIPLELFGLITGVPGDSVPWDGPRVRVVEHRGHADGHAALVVEESGVLIAGDMLSDVLVPFPDLGADDPIGDYLAGLARLEEVAGEVSAVIPGHGSVGGADEVRARIDLDRAYVHALADGRLPDDPRIGPAATFGEDWLPEVAQWQVRHLAEKRDSTPD